MAKGGWMSVRTLDFRIDLAARNSAVAIKARGGGAAEQFLRRLAVHLDEVPDGSARAVKAVGINTLGGGRPGRPRKA
jgi:hypothetical protein